jgi:RNA polymerase sigma-70 factor (ECF subfamily)
MVVGRRTCTVVANEKSLDGAMQRYARGDGAAFAEIHAGLHSRIRLFLIRLVRAPSIADELVQETFLRVHRSRGTFMPGAAVVPWVYAIARNAWLNYATSANLKAHHDAEWAANLDARRLVTGPEADSEQIVIARETARQVERVLGELPPQQREAFILLRYEGLSLQEAAQITGSTEAAVKLRAFRAYARLRDALGRRHSVKGNDDE